MSNQGYRQGDVMLFPVESIPEAAVAVEPSSSGVVLAYGEVTGHHHRIADTDAATLFEYIRKGVTENYLQVNVDSPLVHEEHEDFIVAPGLYKIIQKREYTARNGERRVTD
jgi:hypothetical protein